MAVSVKYIGTKKVKSVKAVKKAAAAEGHALSASVVGEIVCSDGLAYAAADKDNLPSGVTAVAMVAYKGASAGSSLAIALTGEGSMNWSTAKSTCEGKDPIGGNSWRLPSIKDWQYMIIGCEGSGSYCDPYVGMDWRYVGLRDNLSAAGGTALKSVWSSTESEDDPDMPAWRLNFQGSYVYFFVGSKDDTNDVRACLAF